MQQLNVVWSTQNAYLGNNDKHTLLIVFNIILFQQMLLCVRSLCCSV